MTMKKGTGAITRRPSFFFLIALSSLIIISVSTGVNSDNVAYGDTGDGTINITFDSNPRMSPIVIDGVIYLPSQQPVTVSWKNDSSTHTFSIPEPSVYEGTGKKYVFGTWNDLNEDALRTIKASKENHNKQLLALFDTQYLLTILSDYGAPKGADWYSFGAIATIEMIEPTIEVSEDIRVVFNGWSTGYLPNSLRNSLEISGPMVVVATWKEQYRLEIDSNIGGGISGSGWYDKGMTAKISASDTVEFDDGKKKFTFSQWKVASSSTLIPQIENELSPATTLIIDRPYHLEAQWDEAYFVRIDSIYGEPVGNGYYKSNELAKITVNPIHEIQEGKIRLVFSGWEEVEGANSSSIFSSATRQQEQPQYPSIPSSEGSNIIYITVNEPKTFRPLWKIQYFVDVISEYSLISGGGWYDHGSTVTVSAMPPTTITSLGFGKSAILKGWSLYGSSPTTSSASSYVISNIEKPYQLHAVWIIDETLRYIIITLAIGVIGVLAVFIILTNNRKKKNYARSSYVRGDDAAFDVLWAIENMDLRKAFVNQLPNEDGNHLHRTVSRGRTKTPQ